MQHQASRLTRFLVTCQKKHKWKNKNRVKGAKDLIEQDAAFRVVERPREKKRGTRKENWKSDTMMGKALSFGKKKCQNERIFEEKIFQQIFKTIYFQPFYVQEIRSRIFLKRGPRVSRGVDQNFLRGHFDEGIRTKWFHADESMEFVGNKNGE